MLPSLASTECSEDVLDEYQGYALIIYLHRMDTPSNHQADLLTFLLSTAFTIPSQNKATERKGQAQAGHHLIQLYSVLKEVPP